MGRQPDSLVAMGCSLKGRVMTYWCLQFARATRSPCPPGPMGVVMTPHFRGNLHLLCPTLLGASLVGLRNCSEWITDSPHGWKDFRGLTRGCTGRRLSSQTPPGACSLSSHALTTVPWLCLPRCGAWTSPWPSLGLVFPVLEGGGEAGLGLWGLTSRPGGDARRTRGAAG